MSEVLRRAVQVLDVLRVSGDGLTIREVSAQVGLPKSTVQRLLRELCETELAGQDAGTRRYRLGPRTLALGTAYQRRLDVRAAALPHMVALRDALGETVGLSVLIGEELLHVEQVESRSALRATFEVGTPLPLWSGAPSRVLMADLTDDEVRRIVGRRERRQVQPANPPGVAALVEAVGTARQHGHAMAFEETVPGVNTVSVPVEGPAGVAAALSVTGPTTRFDEAAMTASLALMHHAGVVIGAALGKVDPPASRERPDPG